MTTQTSLKILTPERTVLDTAVDALYARMPDGEFGVLKGHIPLVAPLEIAELRYVQQGQTFPVAVMGGVLQTDGDTITVLCDNAELGSEIDAVRAQHAKERAEARLRENSEEIDFHRAQLALARSLVRLKVSSK